MSDYEVVFDKELIPFQKRKRKWEATLEGLDCERSFVTHFNAKSAIFQAARKLGIKVKSSQLGLEKDQVRIWRIK